MAIFLKKMKIFGNFFKKNVKVLAIFRQSNGNFPEGQIDRYKHQTMLTQGVEHSDDTGDQMSTHNNPVFLSVGCIRRGWGEVVHLRGEQSLDTCVQAEPGVDGGGEIFL